MNIANNKPQDAQDRQYERCGTNPMQTFIQQCTTNLYYNKDVRQQPTTFCKVQ